MRVLLLTTRPSVGPARLRGWSKKLGVGRRGLSVVAIPEQLSTTPLPVGEAFLLPRSGRPGALPWRAPTRNNPARLIGGNKVTRVLERRMSGWLDRAFLALGGEGRRSDLAARFAEGCAKLPRVDRLFARADLVIAVDADACWAAWLMAQRHPRPLVVHGLAAGMKATDDLRRDAERAAVERGEVASD